MEIFFLVFFFFWCGTFLKVFVEFLTILFILCFGFFGSEVCGILAPQPGIELARPALEGKVLTTGPPGKSQGSFNFLFLAIMGLQLLLELFSSCGAEVPHCSGFSWCGAWALGHTGFSRCSFRAPESRLNSSGIDSIAPCHVGSSQIRDRTCVSCICRWVLHHWASREAPKAILNE